MSGIFIFKNFNFNLHFFHFFTHNNLRIPSQLSGPGAARGQGVRDGGGGGSRYGSREGGGQTGVGAMSSAAERVHRIMKSESRGYLNYLHIFCASATLSCHCTFLHKDICTIENKMHSEIGRYPRCIRYTLYILYLVSLTYSS